MESAKLAKATGEPLRALQELENSMRLSGLTEDPDTIDLTSDDDAELKRMRAKASICVAFFFFPWILFYFQNDTADPIRRLTFCRRAG